MAILDNTPLGFNNQELCGVDAPEYCQIVAKEDNPVWQIVAVCDELTGGEEKLPCESNNIGNYTDAFAMYQNDDIQPIDPKVLINSNSIEFNDASSGANIVSTPEGFLRPNTCYFLRYTISSYTSGFLQTINTTAPQAEGANARKANGTYVEKFCTDADGRLRFQFGNDDTPLLLNDFILSNIYIGCIRYDVLYNNDDVESSIDYPSQTTFCKTKETENDVTFTLEEQPFIDGKTYKICLTISGMISGSVTINFGSTPVVISSNGTFCNDIEYDSGVGYSIVLSDDFVGCVSDITANLVPEIKAFLYDSNGDIVEDGIIVEPIGNTVKVSLSDTLEEGCYTIKIADSCSNFKKQFYGSLFDYPSYSVNMVMPKGLVTIEDNEVKRSNSTVTFKDAICCGKTYTGQITLEFSANEDQLTPTFITLDILAGGGGTSVETAITSNPQVLNFTFTAGCDSTDLVLDSIIDFNTDLGTANVVVNFNFDDETKSFINMDADQFCPDKTSTCLKVVEKAPCDTLLIQYRNDTDAFGFDYNSDGYREEDGFYNKIRLASKIWKSNYPKVKNIQKNSTGRRTLYYSDVDKKYLFTTMPLPEFIHDALSVAVDHRTLIIDGKEFVCETADYQPNWGNTNINASVELELFLQQDRKLNTFC